MPGLVLGTPKVEAGPLSELHMACRVHATEGSQGSRLARGTDESEGARSHDANGEDESDAEEAPAQALPTGLLPDGSRGRCVSARDKGCRWQRWG